MSTYPIPSLRPVYWSEPADRLLAHLHGTSQGLTSHQAQHRLAHFGPNALHIRTKATALDVFLSQLRSPLVWILIFAAIVSILAGELADAAVVLVVVAGSTLLGFAREYSATKAIEELRARITIKTTVLRDGRPVAIPSDELVLGDVVLLSAGSLIPADGVVLVAKDFFVNQAVLTGETFPVEKRPGVVPARAGLAERTNCVFMGTNARTGTAHVLIAQVGAATAYGQIAERLTLRPPETEFERGIRNFGYLLTQVMTALVLVVFAVNVIFEKPPIDSLLFAIALAVGLAPELLPAIISVNLSKGAQVMAAHGVIVRRLNAIENLGSMDVLCTDKTGTLTEGVVRLEKALDASGLPADTLLRDGYLNARLQTGLSNPLDEAIIASAESAGHTVPAGIKVDEVPYDFVRKRLGVVVRVGPADGAHRLIVKGALENVLSVCSQVAQDEAVVPLDDARRVQIERLYEGWSHEGLRVLGLATRTMSPQMEYTRDDERALTFGGFLIFSDPPKPGVPQAIAAMRRLGVTLKIISGDNRLVAAHLAEQVGLPAESILTGAELEELHDEALWHRAERTSLFVEVDPNEKERIILALQKMGHVVGYMGDGINDAPALHAADVGISVDQAVDVAKEAADFILLQRDLDVLRQGVEAGRATFANTLKYIFTTTSANFGNMFSMAAASLFLPFLPLLAKQILLNNFLSDVPAMTIASDNVDPELVAAPHRWNIRFIRNFMVVFGFVSSVFDFLTFGALLFVVRASPDEFRTGWFVESLMTELVVALIVRTRKPFFRSRPGRLLWLSTLGVSLVTIVLPYLPFESYLGFTPLPIPVMLGLLLITALYVAATELVKQWFYRWQGANL